MRLSKAQVRFLDQWLHVQDYWMGKTGRVMECNPKTGREKATLRALSRKGAVNDCGEFTLACRHRYKAIKIYQERKALREQHRQQQLVSAAGRSPSSREGMAEG